MSKEEAEPNWFAKWEEDLPCPEELMPLSQSLITPDLATAFDIPTTTNHSSATKKPRLVWTPQLHKQFIDAIARLGIKNAVPKTIMQLMNVEGLTRENVASHLQKYRLYLKRMQSSSSSSSASAFAVDAATDRLFATAPVPSQFLERFVPVAAMRPYQQSQYSQQRHLELMMRQRVQTGIHRMACPQMFSLKQPMQNPYVQYSGSGREEEGRRALKLFPAGLD